MAEGDIRVLRENAGGSFDEVRLQDYISSAIVSNYGDNRVLTSDGTISGLVAESGLTFDGSVLSVSSDLTTIVSVVAHGDMAAPSLFYYKRRGTTASPLGISDGDVIAYHMFYGYGEGADRRTADITVTAEDAFLSTAYGSSFMIRTVAEGGTSITERFKINKTGNIVFNGAYIFPLTIGTAGQILKVPTSGTTLEWGDAGSGGVTGVTDGIFNLDITTNTLTVSPYASRIASTFYSGTTTPSGNARINWDGYMYATAFLSITNGSTSAFTGVSSSGYGISATSGTSNGVYAVSTSNNAVYAVSTSGNGIYAASTTGIAGTLRVSPASTSTETPVLRLDRISTGASIASGIGEYISFYIENNYNNELPEVGRLSCLLTNVADGTEDGKFVFYLINNGTMGTTMSLEPGQLTLFSSIIQSSFISDTLYGEHQFYRTRAAYGDLSSGDIVGGLRWTGGVNGSSQDLAYIEGIYLGSGTTQAGQLVLSINNLGTKTPSVSIDAKAGVVIDNDQNGLGFLVKTLGRSDTLKVDGRNDRVGVCTATPASSFELQGSLGLSNYGTTTSITLGNYVFYYTSTASLTFTLPAPTVYRTYIIWNRSSGTLTLARNSGTNKINGSLSNLSIAAGYAYIVSGESSTGWIALRIN